MGFGFNLIGFPLLILTTLGMLAHFLITKKKILLRISSVVWLLIIIMIATRLIADRYRTPIRLTKADIIGEYRIDTNIFRGINANWQHSHYKFIITPTDSIVFYVTSKDTLIRTFKEKIKYSPGPPDLWKVQSNTAFHIIKHPPILFRGHNKFHYVFVSERYGNMFFRKVDK